MTPYKNRGQISFFGQNLGESQSSRERSTNMLNITPAMVKENIRYNGNQRERWRLWPIMELLDDKLVIPGFTQDENAAIHDDLCTS